MRLLYHVGGGKVSWPGRQRGAQRWEGRGSEDLVASEKLWVQKRKGRRTELIYCSWGWLEESCTLPGSEQGRLSSPGKGRNGIQTPVFCREFRGAPLPQRPLAEFRGAAERFDERGEDGRLREGEEGGMFFSFLLHPSPSCSPAP